MFHPTCVAVKLRQLCFADDLILCQNGDFMSSYLLLQSFKLFSNSFGLEENVQKTAVYTCGMNATEENIILEVSGFTKGTLTYGYLFAPNEFSY